MLVVFVVRIDEPLVLESLLRRRAVPGIRLDQRADEGLGVVRDVLPVLVVAVGRVWSVRMHAGRRIASASDPHNSSLPARHSSTSCWVSVERNGMYPQRRQ